MFPNIFFHFVSCFFILSVISISMQVFQLHTIRFHQFIALHLFSFFFSRGYLPFLIALVDMALYCVTSFWCFGEIQFIIEGWIGPGSAAATAMVLFLWNCSHLKSQLG